MMKIRMLTYNNNNAAQWRNDDDSDIFSSSGVKWRHFRWKHVSVALIKTHIQVFSFCSGLSCRSMNINLFSSVDIKLLTGDVSWWIWSVLVFKCVKCYNLYSEGFFLHRSLSAWCMKHFIPKNMETLYGCWRLLCKNMKQDFLLGDVCLTHLSCLTLTFKIWEDKLASTVIFLWWICFLQSDCLVFFFFVSLLFTSRVRSPAA